MRIVDAWYEWWCKYNKWWSHDMPHVCNCYNYDIIGSSSWVRWSYFTLDMVDRDGSVPIARLTAMVISLLDRPSLKASNMPGPSLTICIHAFGNVLSIKWPCKHKIVICINFDVWSKCSYAPVLQKPGESWQCNSVNARNTCLYAVRRWPMLSWNAVAADAWIAAGLLHCMLRMLGTGTGRLVRSTCTFDSQKHAISECTKTHVWKYKEENWHASDKHLNIWQWISGSCACFTHM